MKRRTILFVLLAMFAWLSIPRPAFAEEIRSFDDAITVGVDGRVNVKEHITYDFGDMNRHGIYRTIPFIKTNADGKKFVLGFSDFSVVDDQGTRYIFTTSTTTESTTLKIGSAYSTITGIHPYVISYTVAGALTYFSDHDELYWNVTGNDWQVPIGKATAEVQLPQGIAQSSIQVACYTGAQGNSASNCRSSFDQNNRLAIETTEPLNPYEGLTIVVGFPKHVVAVLEPKPYVPFWETPAGVALIILFILAGIAWYLVLPVWIIVHWFKVGRDPKPPAGEAHVWFDAPKTSSGRSLSPGETGTLVDEEADMRDITATIVDLARRGYMKIVEKKKNDFYLVMQKEIAKDNDLQPHEVRLLDGIFSDDKEVRIKDADLISTVTDVKSKLYGAVVSETFFDKNPQSTRTKYYVISGLALFTGNIFLAIVAFIFGRAMPRKTVLGAQAAAVARGLRTFLTSQEKYLAGQAKSQLFFEKLLPFAIAFGVEKIWAERFKDIDMKEPSWYQGYGSQTFTSLLLVNALSSTNRSFVSAATPTRSSSGFSSGFGGGGFSGGGGGGGGGGSW